MKKLWYRPKAKKKASAPIDDVLMRKACLPLTDDLTVFAISTILGMDGEPKQEGFVLTQLQRKTKAKSDVVELIYADSPEEIVTRIQSSFAQPGE